MITAGILVAYCISIGTRSLDNSGSWRIVIALGIVFALILGVGIMFVSIDPTSDTLGLLCSKDDING